MAFDLCAPFVAQVSATPGTATFSLTAPTAPFRSFASEIGSGKPAVYFAKTLPGASGDGSATGGLYWEYGLGTVTSGSPDTLTRSVVLDGSNGPGVTVNFPYNVMITSSNPPSQKFTAITSNKSEPSGSDFVTSSKTLTPFSARVQQCRMASTNQTITLPDQTKILTLEEWKIYNQDIAGNGIIAVKEQTGVGAYRTVAEVWPGDVGTFVSMSTDTSYGNWQYYLDYDQGYKSLSASDFFTAIGTSGLGSLHSNNFILTGTLGGPATGLGAGYAGQKITIKTTGALTFMNGSAFHVPSGSITTANGTVLQFICWDGTNWDLISHVDNSY